MLKSLVFLTWQKGSEIIIPRESFTNKKELDVLERYLQCLSIEYCPKTYNMCCKIFYDVYMHGWISQTYQDCLFRDFSKVIDLDSAAKKLDILKARFNYKMLFIIITTKLNLDLFKLE